MATYLLPTSATLSTSTGSWNRVESSFLIPFQMSGRNDLNTERTQAVTFTNAGNQTGLFLELLPYDSKTIVNQTITIKLQEKTGTAPDVWTTRTTDTFNLVAATDFKHASINHYFALTSYAVDTTASKWRYAVSTSAVANMLSWAYGAGTVYGYAAVLDYTATKPTTGDTIILANNVTLSMDENASYAGIYFAEDAIFQTLNPVTAALTLSLTDHVALATSGRFIIGSQANPIPAAYRFTLNLNGKGFAPFNYYHFGIAFAYYGYPYHSPTVEFWGAENNNLQATLAADANAGQKVIVTTTDMSGSWSIGDTVTLCAKKQVSTDYVTYTIDNIVGTTITLSANLDYIALAGGMIINYTQRNSLGIWIVQTNAPLWTSTYCWYDSHILQGVFIQGVNYGAVAYVRMNALPVLNTTSIFRDCLIDPLSSQRGWLSYNEMYYLVIDNVVIYDLFGNGTSAEFGVTLKGSNITITDYTSKEPYNNMGLWLLNCSKVTLTRVKLWGYTIRDGSGLATLNLAKSTATDCYFFGTSNPLCFSGMLIDFLRCNFQGGGQNNLRITGNALGITLTDCALGTVRAGTVGEISTNDDFLSQITVYSSEIAATNRVINISDNIDTSYVRFHELNSAANSYTCYEKYGYFQSTQALLTDTTMHTAGGMALRFESSSSTNQLTWAFTVPTGNIQNKTMFISVWCKINSTNYYSVTYQAPRLTIDYDNGTTTYVAAANSTAWQLLTLPFTPTTTYGQVTVTLSTMTDQTGSNAYVYWDDMSVAYPPSVSLDLGGLDNWSAALPVTPPISIPLSAQTVAQSVWEETTAGHVVAGSMGKKLGGLTTPELIVDGELVV